MAQDLLLEIGVEELPASFVASAIEALPQLFTERLKQLRLSFGAVRAIGTPRRLALIAENVAETQPDLDEEVLGPPARVAFDAAGNRTKAALAFATKQGLAEDALYKKTTDKGDYLAARRLEKGAAASAILPAILAEICGKIPFRKSMRWSDGDTTFGRPVRWLLALWGAEELPFEFAGLRSGRVTYGHRFLSPEPAALAKAADYVETLRAKRVLVDGAERANVMRKRLAQAAEQSGGEVIEDEFLVDENLSLVEEPNVVVGSFEERFLALPERVILDVAKGHQRYFGLRSSSGKLMPNYLAVVGTAEVPANIQRGNDRVMRARLSDAKFFYEEDLKIPLGARTAQLDGIVFHKQLGSIGDKVRRIERLVKELGTKLGFPAAEIEAAHAGARLAKCDLVTLMVRELPELQGEMGYAYAIAQGVPEAVARVIAEHYQPRGAEDPTAASNAGALVALADRLDTLTGCFALGLMPSGTADPLALRRAAIGTLRTLIDRGYRLDLAAAIRSAYVGFSGIKLELDLDGTLEKLLGFLRLRLRGVLTLPMDVVDACIAAGADDPYDTALRARALSQMDETVRASVGEVFKRAANIAKDAPAGELRAPGAVTQDVPAIEERLFVAFNQLKQSLAGQHQDFAASLAKIADFAPILAQYFVEVFVMAEDEALRSNRLRLMRDIQQTCSRLANFNLLVKS